MATTDDAATVLEQFCLDVANMPAEMAHLLEEVAAKDAEIVQCRDTIQDRDNTLQKHVRSTFLTDTPLTKHSKEDVFSKIIATNYDRIQALQADKVALTSKAMLILERQLKRLDVKIRNLQLTDQFPHDPTLPSLLLSSAPSAITDTALSALGSPLQISPLNSAQIGGGPNIANAAVARVAGSLATRNLSPVVGQNSALLFSPSPIAHTPRSPREISAETSKRRRLNSTAHSATIPTHSSNLRQSSLDPSSAATPKSGTPAPGSRATSAQPARPSAAARKGSTNKRLAPHQQAAANAAAAAAAASANADLAATSAATTTNTANASRKRQRSSLVPSKKGDRRRQLARDRPSGSPSSPSARSHASSTSPSPSGRHTSEDGLANRDGDKDGNGSDVSDISDDRDEPIDGIQADFSAQAATLTAPTTAARSTLTGQDDEDTQVYCVCQRVSFGNMIACDNDDCKNQWFHWGCVGLHQEPKGEWLCPDCRLLPDSEITRA